MDKLLNDLYYKNKNFVGSKKLYEIAKQYNIKITYKEVRDWLKNQAIYQQTTKQEVKKNKYLPIYSESHFAFQIDLTFFPKYKTQNNGYWVLFTAININTRYGYVYYSKSKDTNDIIDMLEKFKKNALEIDTVEGDLGSEFTNKKVKEWFEDNNVTTFFFKSDSHKLGIINRWHRTIKDLLLKYMLAFDTVKWVDVIDEIIKNYNNTVHSSIRTTPKQASNSFIQSDIICEAREKTENIKKSLPKIEVGYKCRIKTNKFIFDKSKPIYSTEIYTIEKVKNNVVNLIDDKDKHKNDVKISDILIINGYEKPIINKTAIEKANEENKKERAFNKSGLDKNDILEGKRIIKKKIYYY